MTKVILIVAIVCLYSTGHWIGATLLLAWLIYLGYQDAVDPTGIKRMLDRLKDMH